MAISLDATSFDATPATGNQSWSHSGGAGPRAALVMIVGVSPSDEVTGATYAGAAMTELSGSPWISASGSEPGAIHAFLLNGITSGTQTVAFTTSGATMAHQGVCVTFNTTGNDVELVTANAFVDSVSQANPSATLSLGGRTCHVSMPWASGQAAVASVTELAGWTPITEATTGSETAGVYIYDTVAASDPTVGWTQAADDAFAVAIALSEVPSVVRGQSTLTLMGVQ